MHIVFGGAYHGKRAFVRAYLERNDVTVQWIHADETEFDHTKDVLVFDGIQAALFPLTKEQRSEWLDTLQSAASNQTIIWIVEDISRGIVPLQKEDRVLRDESGRITQYLVAEATSVTQIWYGLHEMKKGVSLWE
ncbi:bifunctional adenosylcobinamide kinase/adenosylcobinamide-phosphate guanylyltransferase [Chryseomicrobium aureum]|uniref:bifunctional adenosylcobinamide kinase/adenosylcobinamide-phosphate guanylyltransferase n=1 Tax=Chryseomicrobium aureum TaxID=1441723 RepID=UPI00370D106C